MKEESKTVPVSLTERNNDSQIGISSRTMNTSDRTKTSSDSDHFPMTGLKALTQLKGFLTKYETVEIQKYE